MRTDGQMDRHDKDKSRFSQILRKAPKSVLCYFLGDHHDYDLEICSCKLMTKHETFASSFTDRNLPLLFRIPSTSFSPHFLSSSHGGQGARPALFLVVVLLYVFLVLFYVFLVLLYVFLVLFYVFLVLLYVFLVLLYVFVVLLYVFLVLLYVFLVLLYVFLVLLYVF